MQTTTESALPMQPAKQQWHYEPLPMYAKTSDIIGKEHTITGAATSHQMRSAGKSDSGFIEPSQLIATLTKY